MNIEIMYLNFNVKIESSKFFDTVKNVIAKFDRFSGCVLCNKMCDAFLTNVTVGGWPLINRI